MTATQLALCDPAWTDPTPVPRPRGRALDLILTQTLHEPANPNYQPRRRGYRRVRDVRLANQEYL